MTPSTRSFPCSMLLLAGGRGHRMGGADKGLLEWHGLPLIAHLHALTRPLTDDLIISCNRNHERYSGYADQLVTDPSGDFPGPLAGILAGLKAARHAHVLVLPCDSPLMDRPLLHAMLQHAEEQPEIPLMLRRETQWEPLFSVIPTAMLELLQDAWQAGERSTRRALLQLGAQALSCQADDPRLANLNTPQLLNAADNTRKP